MPQSSSVIFWLYHRYVCIDVQNLTSGFSKYIVSYLLPQQQKSMGLNNHVSTLDFSFYTFTDLLMFLHTHIPTPTYLSMCHSHAGHVTHLLTIYFRPWVWRWSSLKERYVLCCEVQVYIPLSLAPFCPSVLGDEVSYINASFSIIVQLAQLLIQRIPYTDFWA